LIIISFKVNWGSGMPRLLL